MKLKTIRRAEWRGIRSVSYAERRASAFGLSGVAGLLRMDDAEDFWVDSGGRRLKITGNGYSWLQLAPENARVWATVMFDERGRLFQCYFDITRKNTVRDGGLSEFEDLYLDVVALPDREELIFYDEDELENAYLAGSVSPEERALAYKARDELVRFLTEHKRGFFDFCAETRRALLKCL